MKYITISVNFLALEQVELSMLLFFFYLIILQIDSDILKELPEDIAQEIVAGLTLQRQQRGRPNREEADRHANIQDSDRRQTRAHNDVQDEPALPSLSQVFVFMEKS